MKSYNVVKKCVATATFRRATGHDLYGKVVVAVAPAAAFSFRSDAVWSGMNHELAVRTGILEVLASAGLGRGLAADFVLQEIDGSSQWDAYYEAAKLATLDILREIEVAT